MNVGGEGSIPANEANERHPLRALTGDVFELIARLGLFLLLVIWSGYIILPFLPILLWSLVLTVTLYPAFEWVAKLLGGRRRLAAAVVTMFGIVILTGPIIWLGANAIENLWSISERINAGDVDIPPPPESVRNWPFVGERVHHIWATASTDVKAAIKEALPRLQPLKSFIRKAIESVATGVPIFLVSLIIAGFLFCPAPSFLEAIRRLSQRLLPAHGQEFLVLAGATMRNVAQGVIGIALLQAILAGLGFVIAGLPGSGLLALAILIAGILRVDGLVMLAILIWCWSSLSTGTALALTAYLVPVSFINNILSPFVMARGLRTPMAVIFLGALGGAISHGLIGLFLGPIVLAVTWELIAAWVKQEEAPEAERRDGNGTPARSEGVGGNKKPAISS